MCYSNSLTATNIQLEKTYQRSASLLADNPPIFLASGFSFPVWPVVTKEDTLIPMQWGLVPAWFRGIQPQEIAGKTLNARLETLSQKASFKHLISSRRCIIPSTGFFENQSLESRKKPFFIYPKDGLLFHMAGLYDTWINQSTRAVYHGFSIITTEANPLMAEIHNTKKRMPLLIHEGSVAAFLQEAREITSFAPIDEQFMAFHPISKRIFTSETPNVPGVQQRMEDNIGTQGVLF